MNSVIASSVLEDSTMASSKRSVDDMKLQFRSCKDFDQQERIKFYDSWAETYDQDVETLDYTAPRLAVELLSSHFPGPREEARVLDVACGSGLFAKLMCDVGFRHFVGVDASRGMLDQAAATGLYQDLRLAILGPEPLPVQPGTYDVVAILSSLHPGFVPMTSVREMYDAVKPGGLVCIVRGDLPGEAQYKQDLERELQLMEEEALWRPAGTKLTNRYMIDTETEEDEAYVSGTVYLYRKSAN